MLVICVEFEIMPRHLDDFLVAMRKNAAQSHALEAGCQQFDVCQDQQNPNTIFLYEIYDDEAAFEAHKSAPHYHEFNHAIDGMVVKKSVRLLQNISHHS
jgi:quinol monooxygenase YgiN